MELRHLKYFVAIAEEKHYGRAAQKLFVSQPTLSQQIQQLENELGVELFVRATRHIARKVELTEAGAFFLNDAKTILQLSQNAIEQVRKVGLQQQAIRLGTYKMVLRERIVEMLATLHQAFPHVAIKLVELPTSIAVEQGLLEESLDLGLVLLPVRHENLSAKLLKQGHLCLMMNKAHVLSNQPYITLETLGNEQWIELSREIHPFFEEIETACKQAGFSRKGHIKQEVSSLELLSACVGMDMGIAFVSSQYDLSREQNVVVQPILRVDNDLNSLIHIDNALAYKTEKNTPLIQALIGLLQI
ncbi:MAG: LysR family transcriptional regulator [Runella slithyformis]|nr:MAG: LysR family transcriptional regulator [Runella slithyformis]TAF00052.1 MAG: LysR family transcriptional regulator [Runella slithyformis]TAF28845.1 MAG: LysR family transcriptional regulator [Runella slithyformis]TAF48962.1 MAG: LysR family transcriptional regulator [Runella slithyformis]TAF83522.1 MAG: LysR family transcriptional regulator [Runella slithyformis]